MENIIQEPKALVYTCESCGCEVVETAAQEVNSYHYCQECFETHFITCADCGELIPFDESHRVVDDRCVCETCRDENYDYCRHCDTLVSNDDLVETGNGDLICGYCAERYYTECAHCTELYRNDELHSDDNCTSICGACMDYYYRCDTCGDFVYRDDVEWVDDAAYCRHCAEEVLRQVIRSYHDNPPTIYRRLGHEGRYNSYTRFYGIELEIDKDSSANGFDGSPDEAAGELLSIVNDDNPEYHFYAMHDGSLSSVGIELISHPTTREYFNEKLAKPTEEMFRHAISLGYRGHKTDTCGLHFHVSRRSLNQETIENMILAMSQFWPIILKLSRRSEDNLARWARKYAVDNEATTEVKKRQIQDGINLRQRYHCLNTTNSSTIELRIFKSTLKYSTFIACWDFFTFLIEWCEQNTIEQIAITTDEQFLALMAGFSDNLKNYLTERGLI